MAASSCEAVSFFENSSSCETESSSVATLFNEAASSGEPASSGEATSSGVDACIVRMDHLVRQLQFMYKAGSSA